MNNSEWWKNAGEESKKNGEKFAKGIKRLFLPCVGIVLLAVLVLTSLYTVGDKGQAVVTTFGKVTAVVDPGIHIKIPFGIQQATYVNVNELQKIEIGFRTGSTNDSTETVDSESKMISGDYNIVNCDFFVEYKISDPVKYLYSSADPREILKSLAQSHIRNVISSYDVDSILTTGKGEI